jgi:hypothetical protein
VDMHVHATAQKTEICLQDFVLVSIDLIPVLL